MPESGTVRSFIEFRNVSAFKTGNCHRPRSIPYAPKNMCHKTTHVTPVGNYVKVQADEGNNSPSRDIAQVQCLRSHWRIKAHVSVLLWKNCQRKQEYGPESGSEQFGLMMGSKLALYPNSLQYRWIRIVKTSRKWHPVIERKLFVCFDTNRS